MSNALPRKLRVFLCHATEDKDVVRELWGRLKKINWVESWLDEVNLLPGLQWRLEIYNAVSKADIVLVFVSNKSTTKRGFVQKEVQFALDAAQEKPTGEISIIPVKIEEKCEVPVQIFQYQCQNYYPNEYRSIAFDRLLTSFSYQINELRRKGENIVEAVYDVSGDNKIREEATKENESPLSKRGEENEVKHPPNSIEKFRYYGWATCKNPGLLLYIIDVSESMNISVTGKKRINLVTDLLQKTFQSLISLSHDADRIYPTYKIGIYAYAENIIPFYDGGLKTLDEVAVIGAPQFDIMKEGTDTAKAFAYIINILKGELATQQDSPAPIVCHVTDGDFTGADPASYAEEIMRTGTNYGNTLLQNIFLENNILTNPIKKNKLAKWEGIKYKKDLNQKYARKLFDLSSKIPENYLGRLRETGYFLQPGARLLFPAEALAMVSKIHASPNYLIDCP